MKKRSLTRASKKKETSAKCVPQTKQASKRKNNGWRADDVETSSKLFANQSQKSTQFLDDDIRQFDLILPFTLLRSLLKIKSTKGTNHTFTAVHTTGKEMKINAGYVNTTQLSVSFMGRKDVILSSVQNCWQCIIQSVHPDTTLNVEPESTRDMNTDKPVVEASSRGRLIKRKFILEETLNLKKKRRLKENKSIAMTNSEIESNSPHTNLNGNVDVNQIPIMDVSTKNEQNSQNDDTADVTGNEPENSDKVLNISLSEDEQEQNSFTDDPPSGKNESENESEDDEVIIILPTASQDVTSCAICRQSFKSCTSFKNHLRVHKLTYYKYTMLAQSGGFKEVRKLYKKQKCVSQNTGSIKKKARKPRIKSADYDKCKNLKICPVCQHRFIQIQNLVVHIKKKHKEDENKPFVVAYLESIREASRVCTTSIKLQCPLCKIILPGTRVFRHIKKSHSDDTDEAVTSAVKECKVDYYKQRTGLAKKRPEYYKVVSCTRCGKDVRLRYLQHHLQNNCSINKHHLNRCKVCGSDFKLKDDLAKHMVIHSGTDKNYMCDVCGKSYRVRSSLTVHERSAHQIARQVPIVNYQCEDCDKNFVFKYQYMRHRRKHSDEADEQCHVCGKMFKDKEDMKKHVRTQHLKQYKFHCKLCGHGVDKQIYLESHKCGRIRRKLTDNLKWYGDPDSSTVFVDGHSINTEEVAGLGSGTHNIETVKVLGDQALQATPQTYGTLYTGSNEENLVYDDQGQNLILADINGDSALLVSEGDMGLLEQVQWITEKAVLPEQTASLDIPPEHVNEDGTVHFIVCDNQGIPTLQNIPQPPS